MKLANSVSVSLPMMTAPAARSFLVRNASSGGKDPSSVTEPPVCATELLQRDAHHQLVEVGLYRSAVLRDVAQSIDGVVRIERNVCATRFENTQDTDWERLRARYLDAYQAYAVRRPAAPAPERMKAG